MSDTFQENMRYTLMEGEKLGAIVRDPALLEAMTDKAQILVLSVFGEVGGA